METNNAQEQIFRARGFRLSESERSRLMSVPVSSVHVDRAIETFMISYSNRNMIADQVCPIIRSSKRSDFIFEKPVATSQQLADTQLTGPRSRPNEIFRQYKHDKRFFVKDYGLIDFISADEESNADAPLQPRMDSARVLRDYLDNARELRVSSVIFGSGSYGSNTTSLTGTARWDTATGDPITDIMTNMETPFVTPNTLVLGGQVWPKFRTNPNVIKYFTTRSSTKSGPVPFFPEMEALARELGLEQIIVGRGKYISSAEGATETSSYMWGKSAALIYVDPNPSPQGSATFAGTFRFPDAAMRNQMIPELLNGVRGGSYLKLTHSDDEVVIGGANSGYLLQTVIS